MPSKIRILDAMRTDRLAEAGELIFEYVAATEAEVGHRVPAHLTELPMPLYSECSDPRSAYPAPGTVLIAECDGHAIGCVALRPKGATTAEVKRLYVRPAHRGGVGRALMLHLHEHANVHGITHLVLDVLVTRRQVIALYQSLGYKVVEPSEVSADLLVLMERDSRGGAHSVPRLRQHAPAEDTK